MYLYLVQHGEAKPQEEDPQRPLSEQGASDVGKVAALLASAQALGTGVSIFQSGKLRAAQTADILAGLLKPEGGVSEAEGLAPMDDPGTWAARLDEGEGDTMLVGHLPHMGKLASLLLCKDSEAGAVSFKTGAVLCMRRDAGQWSISWMVVPGLL